MVPFFVKDYFDYGYISSLRDWIMFFLVVSEIRMPTALRR